MENDLENQEQTQEKEEVVTVDNEQENQADAEQGNEDASQSFTQSQVNDIVRARLEKQQASLYKRYGVNDRNELDELIGKSQSYDVIVEKHKALKDENSQLKEKVAFLEQNIEPKRYDDVRTYFKGKGVELNQENLMQEIGTHPEWVKQVELPTTTIKTLAPNPSESVNRDNEKDIASRLFGLSSFSK